MSELFKTDAEHDTWIRLLQCTVTGESTCGKSGESSVIYIQVWAKAHEASYCQNNWFGDRKLID